MNTKRTLLAVAVLALTACSHIDSPTEDLIPVNLSYSTVKANNTKAAQNLNEDFFDSGESVKVQISNTGVESWSSYTFTTGTSGAMTPPNPGPYYPAGSINVDIAAYYPSTAGTSFSVQTDQTSDASYKASDLMFARVNNQAKQVAPVTLNFTHKLTKINVNVTAGDGITSISSISILNIKPTVSFNQTSGIIGSAGGSETSIAMTNNGAAVIPPQTIDGGFLSIVTDKGTATYTVSNKEFEAGKQYTLNITVNLLAVGTTTAITGWTSEGTVNVYPVATPLTVLNATDAHVGWIIAEDGYIYENKAAVDAAGKTGVALIIYVGAEGSVETNSRYRGLAVGLGSTYGGVWGYSVANQYCLAKQYSTWGDGSSTDAMNDMSGIANTGTLLSHSHSGSGIGMNHSALDRILTYSKKAPAGTSGWFLASAGQWNIFLHNYCGIDWDENRKSIGGKAKDFVNNKYHLTGYTNDIITENEGYSFYLTSTEMTDGSGDDEKRRVWMFNFYYSTYILVDYQYKNDGGGTLNLPFLAF